VTAVLRHAEGVGFRAVFVTVDTPNTGNREQTFGDPQFVQELAASSGYPPDRSGLTQLVGPMRPFCTTLDWDDIKWISTVTSLPIVLKGISSPEDAAIAASLHGVVAGIVISNHGGRNLDGAIGTADALRRCAAAVSSTSDSQCQVFVDGGIRRGKDVMRALALGASAVLIGRPIHWGLTLGGAQGVKAVLELLRQELIITQQLCGCASLSDITAAHVWRAGSNL
jgi:4-hydroxymandelate oxidase